MSKNDLRPVLVLGGTGTQGGAVARALRAKNIPVRGMARSEEAAAKLAAAGVLPVRGDFGDAVSLVAACTGVRAVFSVQNAPLEDSDSERREGRLVVAAAAAAGVSQIVHTSVSGAGAFHRTMRDWGTGRWNENYWESKAAVEDEVRRSGIRWTILKPAFLMENFLPPKVDSMFPSLAQDELVTALRPDTKLVLVAAGDIGAAAVAAIEDPERFNHQELELAGDRLTMAEIAAVLSRARGRKITARSADPEEAVARGLSRGWVESQLWANEINYPATPEESRRYGLSPTTMAQWAEWSVKR